MTVTSFTPSGRVIEPELFITGKVVALEIAPVMVVNRITSELVDYAVYVLRAGLSVITVMVLAISMGSEFRENLALTQVMLSLVLLAWMVVIPLPIELLSEDRSPGCTVTRARVARDDGGIAGLRHCLVRTLLAVVKTWGAWTVPTLCVSVASKQRKRFEGMLAGTYAARERHRSHMASSLLMPPGLVQWAADTGLHALPGNLNLTARIFLQRVSSLVSSSRHQLGLELVSQVQGYVSPPSPTGIHPEWLLTAILIGRRNRELVLEGRDRQPEEDMLRDMARPPYGVGGETRRR